MDTWRNCKVRNIDETYKTELNFVDEFNLSRNGMIKEIEQEFNIIILYLIFNYPHKHYTFKHFEV